MKKGLRAFKFKNTTYCYKNLKIKLFYEFITTFIFFVSLFVFYALFIVIFEY